MTGKAKTPDDAERYTCEACGGTFTQGRSDDEARAEAERLHGQSPDTHDMAVVCDECFEAMRQHFGWDA